MLMGDRNARIYMGDISSLMKKHNYPFDQWKSTMFNPPTSGTAEYYCINAAAPNTDKCFDYDTLMDLITALKKEGHYSLATEMESKYR
jgi:hypothetical protein